MDSEKVNGHIRPVSVADTSQIARIYNHYVSDTCITFETEPISAEEMSRRISSVSQLCPYFVYEEEGEVLGFCYVHPWKIRDAYSHTFEVSVYVDIRHQACGIGRALTEHILSVCRADDRIHVIIACITSGNIASVNMFESLGFEQASCFRAVGRKFDRWLDIVDFELIL